MMGESLQLQVAIIQYMFVQGCVPFYFTLTRLVNLQFLFAGVCLIESREILDVKVMRTRGTSPQLHALIGGKAKRRRFNLQPYGWSLLVIRLEIKQARTFNNQGFLMHFYYQLFKHFFLIIVRQFLRIIKKTCVFFLLVSTLVLLGADSKQLLGTDS